VIRHYAPRRKLQCGHVSRWSICKVCEEAEIMAIMDRIKIKSEAA
jgi:hypothetical protein